VKRPGPAANLDPKIRLLRRADTAATNRFGIGGRPKTRRKPAKITLPRIRSLEKPED